MWLEVEVVEGVWLSLQREADTFVRPLAVAILASSDADDLVVWVGCVSDLLIVLVYYVAKEAA